jgi:hypothetical protein
MYLVAEHVEPSSSSNENSMSEADLNRLYSDLYNFKMCGFCGLPVFNDSDFCSDACHVAAAKETEE